MDDILPGVGSPSMLLDSSGSRSQDKLSLLKHKIAELLETSSDNIDIISVTEAADTPGSVDVTYAAHGSPYYTPEKLDTVVWMNRQPVSSFYGSPVLCRLAYELFINCMYTFLLTSMVVACV